MKKTTFLIQIVLLCLNITSCDKNEKINESDVNAVKYENLYAPQDTDYENGGNLGGEFVKFDFSNGTTTESETDWDIAFRGTTILVNGGTANKLASEPERTGNAAAYISYNMTFNEVTEINTSLLKQDNKRRLAIPTGSENGWYAYSFDSNHRITALAGRILIIRTADNKYAKMEILSYYKNGIWNKGAYGRYYTFIYKYLPKGTIF